MSNISNDQKLLIGPWAHGVFDSDVGELSFGEDSSGDSIDGEDDVTSLHIKWFDRWLQKNQGTPSKKEDPVKIFVMGVNEWRTEAEWPLQRTNYTPFYFHNDVRTDHEIPSGKLSMEAPEGNQKSQYVHDPHHPVPTNGGGTLFFKGRNSGPRDQREIEQRDDVVIYTSEPMSKPLEVTGWITVVLWASSDAVHTDFTAKLVDVFSDGRAYNLTDGIVRTKDRQDEIKDEIVQYEIDLWATSNVFLPGHSIRIEIASSNFPRFDVNPNTGDTTMDTVEMIQANQTIYGGSNYPSHVLLPIID